MGFNDFEFKINRNKDRVGKEGTEINLREREDTK